MDSLCPPRGARKAPNTARVHRVKDSHGIRCKLSDGLGPSFDALARARSRYVALAALVLADTPRYLGD